MQKLDSIAEQLRKIFDAQTSARDQALNQTRAITRHCALAIRAVHRQEKETMEAHLAEAHRIVANLKSTLANYPDLYYAGYTQDALKEYVEACNSCALINDQPLLTPEELGVPHFTYLNGLAEVIGELRRRILDILRLGYSQQAEHLLEYMDDIYAVLVTMDYPDAITNGLRRQTDVARSIIERTRSDVTFSLRSEQLTHAMAHLSRQLNEHGTDITDESAPLIPPEATED